MDKNTDLKLNLREAFESSARHEEDRIEKLRSKLPKVPDWLFDILDEVYSGYYVSAILSSIDFIPYMTTPYIVDEIDRVMKVVEEHGYKWTAQSYDSGIKMFCIFEPETEERNLGYNWYAIFQIVLNPNHSQSVCKLEKVGEKVIDIFETRCTVE